MNAKNRRDAKRFPIKVLVKCLPPGVPAKRNGHNAKGWEMWARDMADDGVGLQWSRRWATQRCPRCSLGVTIPEKPRKELCLCSSPNDVLKEGQTVELEGLVYTEEGSARMQGRIQWIRRSKRGDTYDVGIFITTPEHRDLFRALAA